MQKLRLVVLAALAAIVGLVVVLRLASHRTPHSAAPKASATAVVAAGVPPVVEPRAAASSAESKEFSRLPDGSLPPPLPAGAPSEVGFGVILFTYSGAQAAPRTARSKAEALELARRHLPAAQTDFEVTAKQGDPGSAPDAGNIPRGILEPPLEYALFTLEKGQTYPQPLDTPRGYWLLKRRR